MSRHFHRLRCNTDRVDFGGVGMDELTRWEKYICRIENRMDWFRHLFLHPRVKPQQHWFIDCPICQKEARDKLMEQGRRMASQREDLIIYGVDPTHLEIPLSPEE